MCSVFHNEDACQHVSEMMWLSHGCEELCFKMCLLVG